MLLSLALRHRTARADTACSPCGVRMFTTDAACRATTQTGCNCWQSGWRTIRQQNKNHQTIYLQASASGETDVVIVLNCFYHSLCHRSSCHPPHVCRHESDIPTQHGSVDCGAFVIEYARHLVRQQPMTFKQEDMPGIRDKLHRALLSVQEHVGETPNFAAVTLQCCRVCVSGMHVS